MGEQPWKFWTAIKKKPMVCERLVKCEEVTQPALISTPNDIGWHVVAAQANSVRDSVDGLLRIW